MLWIWKDRIYLPILQEKERKSPHIFEDRKQESSDVEEKPEREQ